VPPTKATPPIAAQPGTPAVPARPIIGAGLGFPGTPGTPGTPGSPPNYEPGWNAGAQSAAPLQTPGVYSFTMLKNVVGVYTGLTSAPDPTNQNAIEFGFLFGNGVFYVAERRGDNIVVIDGPHTYADNAAFSIVLKGNVVRYTGPSSYAYTSTRLADPSAAYYAQASLFFGGDSVDDAAFSFDPTLFASSGSITQLLSPLVGGGSDSDGIFGTLSPLIVDDAGVDSTLSTLTPSFDSVADPVVSGIEGYLWPPLAAFAIGAGGQNGDAGMNGILSPPSTFAQQTANGIFSGKLRGLATQSAEAINFIVGTLNDLIPGVANGADQGFYGQLSGYQLFAQGHQFASGRYGFFGELQGSYTIAAQGGAQARLTSPRFSLSASGTTTALGEAYLTAPSFFLMAGGTATDWGVAYLKTGGRYPVVGLGGARARMELQGSYTLNTNGYVGNVGTASLRIGSHHYVLDASGTIDQVNGIAGVLIGPQPVNSGTAYITGPRFTIVATGSNVAAVTYEGYSHTLLEGGGVAVTHLTNYPFDHLLRFGTRYFGVRADGLYELTGNTFNGDPIISVVQTGESDVGEPSLKRTRHLNIAGRLSRDLGVTVYANEDEAGSFTYDPVEGGARNTRVTLGRGIEARYLAFGLTNTDGQDFEIHELAPEIDILRRTA